MIKYIITCSQCNSMFGFLKGKERFLMWLYFEMKLAIYELPVRIPYLKLFVTGMEPHDLTQWEDHKSEGSLNSTQWGPISPNNNYVQI